ncbi:MAG TPA: hypothetical protein VGM39_08005 [Kofleriaceae bacterium]|jgi:hypothetical protein
MICSICQARNASTRAEMAMHACTSCAKTHGVVPMPELTRPPASCTRCNSRKFVRAIPREHSTTRQDKENAQLSTPMRVTHDAASSADSRWSEAREALPLEIEDGYGMLEMFICYGCGLVEWYVPTVQSIPISPAQMTEIVDYDADKDTPYR